jgi:hypothetical protein
MLRMVPLPRSVSLRGGGHSLVIARSGSDEAIQLPATAHWIASLPLAMTSKRRRATPRHPSLATSPSSPPGLTRWSMLKRHESNNAAKLSERKPRMDCRVKPGNDDVGDDTPTSSLRGAKRRSNPASRASQLDCFAAARNDGVKNRSRDTLARPSFANHHHARKKIAPTTHDPEKHALGLDPMGGVRFSDQIMRRKREAKRRKAHANHVRAAATNVTIRRCLPRGCAPLSGARPPSGASPRHSPKASTPMAQPQNRVSSKHGEKSVLPARRTTL